MRTYVRAFADLSCYFHKYCLSSLKSAFLQHCTFRFKSACVHFGCSMIVHALIILLSRASLKHSPHSASCFPASCLCVTFNTVIKRGENAAFPLKCGLIADYFGPHADQVCNCGPLWKHCSPSCVISVTTSVP